MWGREAPWRWREHMWRLRGPRGCWRGCGKKTLPARTPTCEKGSCTLLPSPCLRFQPPHAVYPHLLSDDWGWIFITFSYFQNAATFPSSWGEHWTPLLDVPSHRLWSTSSEETPLFVQLLSGYWLASDQQNTASHGRHWKEWCWLNQNIHDALEISDLWRRVCRTHPQRVGPAGHIAEKYVHRCDAGGHPLSHLLAKIVTIKSKK